MPRCADIRFMSAFVKVGVLVLQQLAHVVQSISCQTLASTLATSSGMSCGTMSSNFLRNADNSAFFLTAFTLNFLMSITHGKYSSFA